MFFMSLLQREREREREREGERERERLCICVGPCLVHSASSFGFRGWYLYVIFGILLFLHFRTILTC